MIPQEIINKIKTGAKVKVYSLFNKDTLPSFEGIVIARKHGKETGATFTVRSIIGDVGVEKTFPIHSPSISKIEIISFPKKVKRSKIYWIRSASGSKIRKRLKTTI